MSTGWMLILFLHLIAMAFFVGGQIMMAAAVVPVNRDDPNPDRMRAMAQRFGIGTLIALVVLAVTGVAMASRFGLWDSATLHLKLTLIVLVLALTAIHMRRPQMHALQGLVFLVTLAIVWLGLDLTR